MGKKTTKKVKETTAEVARRTQQGKEKEERGPEKGEEEEVEEAGEEEQLAPAVPRVLPARCQQSALLSSVFRRSRAASTSFSRRSAG